MINWKEILFGFFVGLLFTGVVLLLTARPNGVGITLLPAPTLEPIVIYVTGAVIKPGVYSLPSTSRVSDAIQIAGGFLSEADEKPINLAARIKDGDKVQVPFLKTEVPMPTSKHGITPSNQNPTALLPPSPDNPLNINSASLEELDMLPGIGPSKAQQIIDYREQHGPFSNPQDIQKVGGIGPSVYDKIKDMIITGP